MLGYSKKYQVYVMVDDEWKSIGQSLSPIEFRTLQDAQGVAQAATMHPNTQEARIVIVERALYSDLILRKEMALTTYTMLV